MYTAVQTVQIPGLSVAYVLIQDKGLVLCQDTYGIDTGIDAVTKGKIDDAVLAAEGDSRLGGLFGENLQTAALTTGQQHGDTAFFLEKHKYNSLSYLSLFTVDTKKEH